MRTHHYEVEAIFDNCKQRKCKQITLFASTAQRSDVNDKAKWDKYTQKRSTLYICAMHASANRGELPQPKQ